MTEPMSRAHRAYVIAMAAIIGGAFAYAACDWGRWPRLTYMPLTGELGLHATGTISMTYLGVVAWGTGGALCGALLGALAVRLVPRPWPPLAYRLIGAWAITAILLAGAYFTWTLMPWT